MADSLTAPERETVILMDDSTDTARITTWQRRVMTRLKNNPSAVLIEEMRHGTSIGAVFEMPAALISYRSKRAPSKTPEQIEAARERMTRMRRAQLRAG